MKIKLFFCITISSFLASITHGMDQKTLFFHEATGVHYTKNNFGDVFPQWQSIPDKHLTEHLSSFIHLLKNENPEKPFIVEVPHEKAGALDAIKKAGFTFYHGNNNKTEWIFKNNSTIPEPYTSHIGGGVLVRKGNDVLFMIEKTRPQYLCTPGGTADLGELVRHTASREMKEEVNLTVDSDDLELLAIINRTKANRFGANNSSYYYIVDHSKVSGDLIPNPNEVVRAFYVPLEDIASQKAIDGILVYPAFAAMAKHLLKKNSKTHHKTFLDYRQITKPDSEQNHDDIMTIEFFAQK